MIAEKFPFPSPLKKTSFSTESPEFQQLKERVKKIASKVEKIKTPEERERMIKEEIKSYLEELQQLPSFAPPPTTHDEVQEISQMETDQQVGALISLVFEKGLTQAISIAKALNNPAVLDEFHDTLVDRYYEMLVEKKILNFK